MSKLFVIFDFENKRVGIADAKHEYFQQNDGLCVLQGQGMLLILSRYRVRKCTILRARLVNCCCR